MPFDYKLLGYDDNCQLMFQSAERALDLLGMSAWTWVRDYEGPYLTEQYPHADMIAEISRCLPTDIHSGSSFGWTMRTMQYIAKNGMEAFIKRPHHLSYKAYFRAAWGDPTDPVLTDRVLVFDRDDEWWNMKENRFRTLEEHVAWSARKRNP